MNPAVNQLLRRFLTFTSRHSASIITATAVVGVVNTTVLAVRAGRETDIYLGAARFAGEFDQDMEGVEKAKAVVKATWKIYMPVVISASTTIACIILMHRTHQKRYAALMGMYVLGEKALQEYRDVVEEVVDSKTMEKVKEGVVKKKADRDPESLDRHIEANGDESLFFDGYTGRYFTSSIEAVRSAENEFNRQLIHHSFGTLNEFYSLLGLEGVAAGEDVGWNSDRLLSIDVQPWLTKYNKPAVYIGFDTTPPKLDFYRS